MVNKHGFNLWLNQIYLPTCCYHNFVNNGPILTILVPICSPWSGLSIGTKMVKIGQLLTKLWVPKVNAHIVNHLSTTQGPWVTMLPISDIYYVMSDSVRSCQIISIFDILTYYAGIYFNGWEHG